MNVKVFKNKKNYSIELCTKNEKIETFQTNKIEQFILMNKINKKIKKLELSYDFVLMFKTSYPKISKKKILKAHKDKFEEINNNTYLNIKTLIIKDGKGFKCITYYIKRDIIDFIENNKIKKNKLAFMDEKAIFNKKYQHLILINEFGIHFISNYELIFYNSNYIKQMATNENLLISLIFMNINIKKVFILIAKEIEQEYSNFIKFLYENVEERVKIIVEKM